MKRTKTKTQKVESREKGDAASYLYAYKSRSLLSGVLLQLCVYLYCLYPRSRREQVNVFLRKNLILAKYGMIAQIYLQHDTATPYTVLGSSGEGEAEEAWQGRGATQRSAES